MNKTRGSSPTILLLLNLVVILCCFFQAASSEDISAPPCQSKPSQDTTEKMLDIAGVRPGMTIGEIGSGGGPFTFRLAERVGKGGRIYANDIDQNALDRIKQKGILNIEPIRGDVDDPRFPDQKLDMIIIRSAFHDLENPLSMLENSIKYLKPGAPIIIIEQLPTTDLPYHVMTQEQLMGIINKSSFELTWMNTSMPTRWIIYCCKVEQVKERNVWVDWLKEFRDEVHRLEEWESANRIHPAKRQIAWERLLNSYRDNNPQTEEDDRLRESIVEKIRYLNEQWMRSSLIRKEIQNHGIRDNVSRIRLRTEYKTVDIEEIGTIIRRLGFQTGRNGRYPEAGDFQNQFEQKSLAGNDVIMDHATGLMWHRSGSEKPLSYYDAKGWTADMNIQKYAGYSDWRIPTIEEVASLFETKKMDGQLQIDSIFSAVQSCIWTGDAPYSGRLWVAVFFSSSLWEELKTNPAWVRPVRSMR